MEFETVMIRSTATGPRCAAALIAAALLLAPCLAQARSYRRHPAAGTSAAAKPDAAAPAKPVLVGNYGDWGAYATQGKSKICYALAQPKDRVPASLKKSQAYVFISNRPAEGVRNEVSVIMGVPLKDGAALAKAEVGSASFDLVSKGQNAWMKNAADETRFLDAMKHGGKLVVKGTLVKGGTATDSYSLSGLAQALERVVKDCQS